MAASLFHLKTTRIIDQNGIADGATLTFYLTGTLTLTPVYTTSDLSVEHPNPLTVEMGAPLPDIYLDSAVTYRVIVRNDAGETIDDIDPYTGFNTSTITGESASAFQIFGGPLLFNFDTLDATTSGPGSASQGAGRLTLGGDPIDDDYGLGLVRSIVAAGGFAHGIKIAETFESTGDSAYAGVDANSVLIGTNAAYNHFYGLQARPTMSGSGGLAELSGVVSRPIATDGDIDALFGVHVLNPDINPDVGDTATTTLVYGVGVDAMDAPTEGGVTYAFYAFGNDSALLGNLLIAGNLTGVTTGTANAWNATGGVVAFSANGGVQMWGNSPGATYAVIRAYLNGAGASKGLSLQDNGGQVLIGATSPTTGATLEVVGSLSTTGNNTLGDAAGDTTTINGKLVSATSTTPASAGAAGTAGTIAWDANFIYVCVATNTWKRVAIATW